jgi:hypothetical protein
LAVEGLDRGREALNEPELPRFFDDAAARWIRADMGGQFIPIEWTCIRLRPQNDGVLDEVAAREIARKPVLWPAIEESVAELRAPVRLVRRESPRDDMFGADLF